MLDSKLLESSHETKRSMIDIIHKPKLAACLTIISINKKYELIIKVTTIGTLKIF